METLVFDPPNHDEFKSKSPEPKKSTKIPVKRQDSLPKLTKNPSMASIKVKKRPNPNPKYAKANEATFHEITRLTSLNDEQKAQIAKLVQEIKTLKIVNARQEKGLLMMDKEQGDYPKLFKSMTEELRIHKVFIVNAD
jgi:hypothetical protein